MPQLPLYQIPMTQPNFVNNPVLTPSQLNELQPIANNLIASQPQQNYNLPPLQPQLQPDNTVPSFVNNPNLSVQQKQAMLNAQPQQVVADVSPQSMAVAGAQRKGIDWGGALQTLGSYLGAAGQGINPSTTTMGAGLSGAGDTVLKHQQDIRNFQTMAPQYQAMGIDTSRLDPRRGGAGISTSPQEMIDLQSKVAERNYLNDYRQTLAEIRAQQAQQKQQSTPTVGDLMLYNPQFKQMMNAQYDFSGGKNKDILNRPAPTALLQNIMPKQIVTTFKGGTTKNINKSGSSDIYYHGGSGGSSKGGKTKKLLY